MDNGKTYYNNKMSSANIGCTETPKFEKKYFTDTNPGTVWRGTSIDETINITFDADTPIKGVALFNHTCDAITFEGSTDAAFTSPETIQLNSKGFIGVDWDYQYYRLLCSATGAYNEIGLIYLAGSVYAFEQNYKWNYSYYKEITRSSRETTSGQTYRKTRFSRRGFNLNFDGMSDTQKETFEAISENDYICFLPTGTEGPIYYGFVEFSEFRHLSPNFHNCNLRFMENPK